MEAKKVNNMPNLQSMSQAKGYAKNLHETLCLEEIDRVSHLSYPKILFTHRIEGSFLFVDIKFRILLFIP